MRLTLGRPHPALRGLVGGYADFEARTSAPQETGEAPGGGVVVIVDLDAGWTVEGERFGSFAGGLYARPVGVRHEGSCRGVQFDLEPPAVRALLGVPAGELGHRTVALEDLKGAGAARLAERLHDAPDAATRFALLDAALLRRADRARHAAPPGVERAWALVRFRGGARPSRLPPARAAGRRARLRRPGPPGPGVPGARRRPADGVPSVQDRAPAPA